MDPPVTPETNVVSFVIRFVIPAPGVPAAYGVIRHVQSDAEQHFTRWADVAAFVAHYVNLEGDAPPGASPLSPL